MEKESIVKPNVSLQESEFKKNSIRILKGSVFAIILSALLLFIYAICLTYTDLSEITMVPVIYTISAVSILIGSTISTRKIRKNGLFNGGIVGLIYIIILYLTSSLCLVGFSLTLNSFLMLGIGTLVGMVGRNYWCKFEQKVK